MRLAIRAYPELYFARSVILGEGDSERLVIPRAAEVMGVQLDPSFVPIVPLGGVTSAIFGGFSMIFAFPMRHCSTLTLEGRTVVQPYCRSRGKAR